MRAVRGTVTSARRVSVSKAALIIGRFAEAGAATGARPDVAAYLRRASAAFDELAQVHKKLRDEHRIPKIEINGGGEEEAEKVEKAKKKKEKRNPSVQEMDEKWRSSDLERGTGSFGVKGEGFEENRRKKESRELEENGLFVLEVEKKKEEEKKQKILDVNGVAEEERSDFDSKIEERVVDGTKKKKRKDKNVDKDSENLEEGAQSEFMESHERRDERVLRKKKKEKKRRNCEEDGKLDRVGLDGDRKKRKHSDDGVVDERELHKKKKRKTKEQDSQEFS